MKYVSNHLPSLGVGRLFYQLPSIDKSMSDLSLLTSLFSLIFSLLLTGAPLFTANAQQSQVVFSDEESMARAYADIQKGKSKALSALALLQKEADQALNEPPRSVMDKDIVPPSGDKHDYISQGPYWWPDPDKPDGLPYIRRDGEVNPEREKFTDRAHFSALMRRVDVLAKTYYFTGEEKYAEKASELLRVWFLDEATRMNPNLNYGQGIPGRTKGRGIGIIETSGLGRITDAVVLLRKSPVWTEATESGMQQWMSDYLDWLRNSQHGKDESVHPNNHGTWYDVQFCALAIFTGQKALAQSRIEAAKKNRLDDHLAADGEQPRETARTRGWSYSVMNLRGLFQIAMLGDYLGMDLWSYQNAQGVTLQDALDYLIPLTLGKKPLPFQQITPVTPESLIPHLLIAGKVYQDKSYLKTARKIRKKYAKDPDYWDLVYAN